MADRREGNNFQLLEFRMDSIEEKMDSVESLLQSIREEQNKTKTLFSAASYLFSGVLVAAWYFIKHWFESR